VARGFYDEATVEALHTWMAERFAAEGARIDAFIYCPHHPDGTVPGYDVVCDHRKPGPGMIETLIARHDVDRRRSFLIGDRESDMGAARAASILGLLHDGTDLEARVAEGLRLTGEQP
jgi:D-glycero-D-manno-heptose 1,7-bisphosphate phosphatase